MSHSSVQNHLHVVFSTKDKSFTIWPEQRMRQTLIAVAVLFLTSLYLELQAQSIALSRQDLVTDRQAPGPSSAHPTSRPRLSLQDALLIAEHYIDREHINVSSYWLYRAVFILYGDPKTPDKDKLPCWHFWWVSDSGDMGDYVEILVAMDGKVWRIPSM
jgi:hypothetical protein